MHFSALSVTNFIHISDLLHVQTFISLFTHRILIKYYLYIPMRFVMRSMLQIYNRKLKISEHGAFPLVSVRVQHEEPGNMHPYNFEPIFV